MPDAYKTVSLTPLTGILDSRSSVDQEAQGAFVAKHNFEISPDGKLRQARGFTKPYNINPFLQQVNGVPCPYKNWDYHDQGVSIEDRKPITMLFPSTTNTGGRKLFLGTKTRLAVLNEAAGTWHKFSPGGLGNDGSTNLTQTRFHAAELQNKVYFTNGIDDIGYYDLIAETYSVVSGLATAGESGGKVTASKVIVQWQGVIFLMNNIEDGKRIPARIRWSDLNNGLAWNVGDPASITDYQDLDEDEEILGAIPLLGSLYIFTDHSIWRCNFHIDTVTGDATLSCSKIYTEPRNRDKCLAYPNTLISTGFEIYYAGIDAIYEFDPYKVQPEMTEWIHRADNIIYDDAATVIDRTCCNSPIAEYHPLTKEIHFSWPSPDVVQLSANICDAPLPIQGSGINRHTLVINVQATTCDYRNYGSTAMVNFQSDVGATGSCNETLLFLGASGVDFCLKQFNVTAYSREFYDAVSDSYSTVGYFPLIRGVFPFGVFDKDKQIRSFRVDAIPETDTGTVFRLRIGTSYKTVNPNLDDGKCGVLWRQFSTKAIKCLDQKTLAGYAASNVRPTDEYLWRFLLRGRLVYYELTITMPNGAAATSGGVSLSRFDVEALQN